MKFFVQHPYKERIELNIGAITQIVGQNNELKYYTWQILNWYLTRRWFVEGPIIQEPSSRSRCRSSEALWQAAAGMTR